jgi:hypothetical protein
MTEEERLVPLPRSVGRPVAHGGDEAEFHEVVDIGEFQARLEALRKRNEKTLEHGQAEWARRFTDIQETMRLQRQEMEDQLLAEMLEEEAAMVERLDDIDRSLRNMIRLFRQLMDERNNTVQGISKLHSWIREVELRQGRKPHPDHRVDLAQKYFVEYLSKQAWIFDNSGGWEVEETPRRRRNSGGRRG